MQTFLALNPRLLKAARGLAGVSAALGSVFTRSALWAGGAFLVMMAFNRIMDYMGRSSDRAVSQIDLLTEGFQKAKNAAGAAATTLRLYDTAQRSLKGLDLNSDRSKELIEAVADVAFPSESGKRDRPKTRALRDELESLRAAGDLEGLRLKIQQQQVLAVARRRDEEQRAHEFLNDQIKIASKEVDRLKASPLSSDANLAAAEKRLADLELQRVESATELLKVNQEVVDLNPVIQQSLERQKSLLTEMRELYSDFPAFTNQQRVALERVNLENELSSVRTLIDLYKEEQKVLSDRGKADASEKDAILSRVNELRGVARRFGDEAARMKASPLYGDQLRALDLSERRKKVLEQVDALNAQRSGVGASTTQSQFELDALRQQAQDREKELIKAQAGLDAKERLAAVRDQIALRRAVVESDIEAGSGGANRTESLVNRFTSLSQSIIARRQELSKMQSDDANYGRIREELTIRDAALERTRLDLIRQSGELRKQEMEVLAQQTKELERQLALSKPEDLLRFISAKNAALRGNVGLGEFFSASPELRQNLQLLIPGLDPRIRDIRSQQAAVAPYQPSSDLLNRSVQEQVDAAIRKTAADHEAAAEAGRLAASLATTTNALKGFQSQLDSFAAFVESKVPNTSYNPQGGGKR